ncbi:MAG: tetratricopeptide repeat protein, partial [Planctomycetota bacterium]
MLALACAAAVSGCAHELPPEALELLDSGRVACQNGQYAAAVERMDRFLAAHEDADRAGEAYYYRGLARYRLGRYEVARADLDTALDEADDERVALAARVALGDLAYDTGDIAQAERRYREAADQIDPGEPLADHVRYRLGCVLQRQGRWEEAALHFRRVVHYFTDSELARR